MKNRFIQQGIKLLVLAAPLLLYFTVGPIRDAVNHIFVMLKNLDIQAIKSYILSFGIWAPIASYFIMLLQSLLAPLPSFVVTFVNAGLFGWWKGALLSWFGTLSGAVMCFWIARYFGREVVARFTTKGALVRVDRFFGRYGKYAVLTARLIPFVSFDVVSYGAGLTSMSFWHFFWATAIGQIPITLVYSYVGSMLTGSIKMIVIGSLLMLSIVVLILMLRKIWRDRSMVSME